MLGLTDYDEAGGQPCLGPQPVRLAIDVPWRTKSFEREKKQRRTQTEKVHSEIL